MALRYLARRALQQRALVPRMPPSAGSRLVCTCGASPPQGVLTNESTAAAAAAASKGNKEPELLHRDFSKLTDEQICQLGKVIYKEAIEDLRVAARYSWSLMGYVALGAGLGFLRSACDDMRNERKITLVF